VEELAKLTGETLAGAVTQAVRERLDRLHRARAGRLADRLLRIGKDCAARLKEPGHGVRAKRSKSGAVSFDLHEAEGSHTTL
jgi:hypothetical protein